MSSTPIPAVPTWQAEFNSRIMAFSEALGIEEKKVREVLSKYGADGKSTQSLDMIDTENALPMNELFSMFVDSGLAKKGNLRMAIPHLRGKTSLEEPSVADPETNDLGSVVEVIKGMTAGMRIKSEWTDRELIESYDEVSSEIWDILRKRSHGRPFIINLPGTSTVDVAESLKMLKIAKKQPTNNKHKINGKPVRVYRSGEFLVHLVDESPFIRGIALVNNYCSQSDTSWDHVSHEARVICRLHVDKIETTAISKLEMKRISKTAKTLKDLRNNLPNAALMYDEMSVQDDKQIPSLKINPDKNLSQPYSGKSDNAFS